VTLPTAPEAVDPARVRRWRLGRRLFVVGLVAFLGAAATGRLGVHSAEVRAEAEGYELVVTYATVTRAGLATPWAMEVRHPGGFDGPVQLATTTAYLEMFDENGLNPDPDGATATADEVLWEFAPPPGDVLAVTFDARLAPAIQMGTTGRTTLLVEDRPVVAVEYRTLVMP
jgi:hypothetical protein